MHGVIFSGVVVILLGTMGSLWMVISLARKIRRRNKDAMQDSILYKILFMIALTDLIGGTNAMIHTTMHLMISMANGDIYRAYHTYMSHQSDPMFYTAQIFVTLIFSTLMWEFALTWQICLLARNKKAKRLNIRSISIPIFIIMLLRLIVVLYPHNNSQLIQDFNRYVDCPFFFVIGFLTFGQVMYLGLQTYNGKLPKSNISIIKRIILFPIVHLICLVPKAIVQTLLMTMGESFIQHHPLNRIAELLLVGFYLLNCLAYSASQKCFSRKSNKQDKRPLNITIFIDPAQVECDFVQRNILGHGACGTVYKGRYRGTPVAIKHLKFSKANTGKKSLSEKEHDNFLTEAATLSRLTHPNIVYFMGAFVKESDGYIMCEYCNCGSLRDVLRYFNRSQPEMKMNWAWKLKIAKGIAHGLNYLHQGHMMHRDLKSLNVLISDYTTAKIGDFGTAKLLTAVARAAEELLEEKQRSQGQLLTTRVGTARWRAPEVLRHREHKAWYSEAIDVYSFGIILWELITFEIPYANITLNEEVERSVAAGERPIIPMDISIPMEYGILMQSCWRQSPRLRPPISDVILQLEAINLSVDKQGVAIQPFQFDLHKDTYVEESSLNSVQQTNSLESDLYYSSIQLP